MTPALPVRVLAVDDEPSALESITVILDTEEDIDVVGTAADGLEAIDKVAALSPDVVVMDLRLPRLDGIEATRRIMAVGCRAPAVLALTTFATDDLAIAAIRAGAAGFCSKSQAATFLAAAVRSVASGETVVSPGVLRVLLNRLIPAGEPPVEGCSPREVEVLKLVAEGLTNEEIAQRLVISEATVRTHVQHLRLKLDARSRVHLVVRAHELRIVGPTSLAPSSPLFIDDGRPAQA